MDPLLEDPELNLPHQQRVAQYIELGRKWSAGQKNRLIKVPATPGRARRPGTPGGGGRETERHLDFYVAAVPCRPRRHLAGGPAPRADLDGFKSVYSIFVSRVDVYTEKAVPGLSPAAQGLVGILNAKRIWAENQEFWAQRPTPLDQEIVFASTGTKKPGESPWKYVEAFAGSDIETNPPATNDAVAQSALDFTRRVDVLPPKEVIAEIDRLVDMERLEATLMAEGIVKFAQPQKSLLGADCREASGPCRPGQSSGTIGVLGSTVCVSRASQISAAFRVALAFRQCWEKHGQDARATQHRTLRITAKRPSRCLGP